MNDDVCVIIPTRNEEKTISELLALIRIYGFSDVIVIDDSSDETPIIAMNAGARVLMGSHSGLGNAIRRGMEHALTIGYKYAVVIDAGGTHNPKHIADMIAQARKGYSLVIASRFMHEYTDRGRRTKLSLFAARCVNKLFGTCVCDVTSGYRCYNLAVYNRKLLSDSQAWGHAVQIELFLLGKINGGTYVEYPVEYLPLTTSTLSLRSLLDAVVVLYRMLMFSKVF